MPTATPYPSSHPYGEIKKSPLRSFWRWFCVSRFRIIVVSAGFLLSGYGLFWILPLFLYNKFTSKEGIVIRPFEVVLNGQASPETGNLLASLLALQLHEKNETLAYELSRIPTPLSFEISRIFVLYSRQWEPSAIETTLSKDLSSPTSHYERAAKGYLMGLSDIEFKHWGVPVIKFFFELELNFCLVI